MKMVSFIKNVNVQEYLRADHALTQRARRHSEKTRDLERGMRRDAKRALCECYVSVFTHTEDERG